MIFVFNWLYTVTIIKLFMSINYYQKSKVQKTEHAKKYILYK